MLDETMHAEIVERMRALRIERKISAQKIADTVGMSRDILANLEGGRRTHMMVNEAVALATFFRVDLVSFILGPEVICLVCENHPKPYTQCLICMKTGDVHV